MDQMDVDHLADVPDTPDRLPAQNINGKCILDRGSDFSMSPLLGNYNLLDGASKTRFKVNDRGVRKFLDCGSTSAITRVSDRGKSPNIKLGKTSSSNNSSIPQRMVIEEIQNHGHNHFQHTKNHKMACQSFVSQSAPVVDLTERDGYVGACKKILPLGTPGSSRTEQNGKKMPLVSRSSSLHGDPSSSITTHYKGKETENTDLGFGHGCADSCGNNTQPKFDHGKVTSTSLSSTTLQRVTGQKRLVRNGCISPHNIARAKESLGKEKMQSDVQLNLSLPATSSSPQTKIGGKEWIGKDLESRVSKGKGVMHIPSTVKEPNAQSSHLPSRNLVNIGEIVKEGGDIDGDSLRNSEEFGGWRSTRNRSKFTSSPFSREVWNLHRENSDCLIGWSPAVTVGRGENGSGVGISHIHPLDLDATATESSSLTPLGQSTSQLKPKLGQYIGHHPPTKKLYKRQKPGLASSNRGECSRVSMDGSEIVCLDSAGNTQKSRTGESRTRNYLGSSVPVVDIDENSPAARCKGSSNQGSSCDDDSAMAIQIEADEILARELQEQLYNEAPSVDLGDMDAHLAFALEQGYDLPPRFSGRRNGSDARRSSAASSSRQPHSRSPRGLSRRGSQFQPRTLNRMAQLRNRFPGRPRTLSSVRERSFLFPEEMDVDLRMQILEALESINDMGVDNSLFQTQRDFNENDYEMLLALDMNNHQHGGASTSQINGLPQSTVQSDNLEEACAICLDTPIMGDIIRHLPCLHKFHKDCIDPWLKRRTCCPVCKSSIT